MGAQRSYRTVYERLSLEFKKKQRHPDSFLFFAIGLFPMSYCNEYKETVSAFLNFIQDEIKNDEYDANNAVSLESVHISDNVAELCGSDCKSKIFNYRYSTTITIDMYAYGKKVMEGAIYPTLQLRRALADIVSQAYARRYTDR